MSSDYYLKNVGRKARIKEEIQRLEHKIKSVLEQLHMKADPLERIDRVDAPALATLALQLAEMKVDWMRQRDELDAIERALGR